MSNYELLPPLSDEEYQALKDNIAEHGVLVPVELDEKGDILDGHHRLSAWHELRGEGLNIPDYPRLIRSGMSEEEKRTHVRVLNLLRRHLTKEQLKEQWSAMRNDGMAYQAIADASGVVEGTVRQAVSQNYETQPAKVTGKDGKKYPPKKKPRQPKTVIARIVGKRTDILPLEALWPGVRSLLLNQADRAVRLGLRDLRRWCCVSEKSIKEEATAFPPAAAAIARMEEAVKVAEGLVEGAAAELQRVAKGECGSPTQTVDCGTGEAQVRNLHYCKRAVRKVAIINSSYIGMKASKRIYSLGVEKIAQYHRLRGDEVYYAGPWVPMMLRGVDRVYFSVIFTWDLPDMINQVNLVRTWGKEVEIGGPAATFMHKYIHTQTGIEPHQGLDDRFEHIPPLIWLKNYRPNMTGGDYQLTFTSRGCPHRCAWCGVKRLEPVALEYDDFPLAPMIGDNNILATSWKHQELVVNKYANFRGKIDINSGFDMRFFTKEHLKLYSRLRLAYWRFAFDSMGVEGDVRRVAAMMRSNGLDRHQVTFYCLIGFPGTTPEECLYRLNTLIGLGLNPYPMRFWPLNSLNRKYVAPGWTENLLQRMTAYFQTPYLWKSVPWENYRPGKKT